MMSGFHPNSQAAQPKSLRCSRDDVNWPLYVDFRTCPFCGEETWATSDPPDYSLQEAQAEVKKFYERQVLHQKFEEFYQRRERKALEEAAKRGLTPEDLELLLDEEGERV